MASNFSGAMEMKDLTFQIMSNIGHNSLLGLRMASWLMSGVSVVQLDYWPRTYADQISYFILFCLN